MMMIMLMREIVLLLLMMIMMMKAKAVITLIQGVAGALVKAVEMDSKVKGEEVEFADKCVVE